MVDLKLYRFSNDLLEQMEYDEESGEIRFLDSDWILMSSATLRSLIRGTEMMLGPGGAAAIWFKIGRHAGREFVLSISKGKLIKPKDVEEFLKTFFTKAGWGKVWIE